MTGDFELVHSSGNVFRDLGLPNPEAEQLKVILATMLTAVLEKQSLTVCSAQEKTVFAAADFSRVRQAKPALSTIDRFMAMRDRLDQDVEVQARTA